MLLSDVFSWLRDRRANVRIWTSAGRWCFSPLLISTRGVASMASGTDSIHGIWRRLCGHFGVVIAHLLHSSEMGISLRPTNVNPRLPLPQGVRGEELCCQIHPSSCQDLVFDLNIYGEEGKM